MSKKQVAAEFLLEFQPQIQPSSYIFLNIGNYLLLSSCVDEAELIRIIKVAAMMKLFVFVMLLKDKTQLKLHT